MTPPSIPDPGTADPAATAAQPSASRRLVLPGRRWRRRLFAALAFAGPGLIAANAGNDAGGIATYASAGAQFGYETLFLMLLITVALIGTTITPYMQFYIAAAVADKGIGPADYPKERIDAIGGAIFADLISMFIIVATAAAITVRAPLDSAAQAAQALRPVAGRFASQLFALGLLGASALAAAVVPLSTAYAVSEAVGAERSVGKRFGEAKLFLGLFTAQVFIGATVALIPGNLIQLLVQAQVLNGVITPILLSFVLILANRRSLLGTAANGRAFRITATTCVAVTAVMAAAVLALTVAGWFGIS